jgi:hypothetical protein
MIKRILLLATAGAMIFAFSVATPSEAAPPHGGLCELTGTASFASPGLKATPNKTLTYSFSGNLTNCHEGTLKAAPPTTGSVSGTINATGHAVNPGLACEGGESKGTANASLSTGSFSVGFTTVGAGAIVLVEGKVISSSDPNIHPKDVAASVLAFQTTTPQNCATSGLTSASFTGVTGTGMLK